MAWIVTALAVGQDAAQGLSAPGLSKGVSALYVGILRLAGVQAFTHTAPGRKDSGGLFAYASEAMLR
jgi:hypothetical protein